MDSGPRGHAGALTDRRAECSVLAGLVEAVRAGESRVLVVHGEPAEIAVLAFALALSAYVVVLVRARAGGVAACVAANELDRLRHRVGGLAWT
jgi:hypothetical protein